MSLIVFQHAPPEHAAVLGAALQKLGHTLRTIRLYAGDAVPADLDEVDGIISMGGPMNVGEADRHPWIAQEISYLKRAHALEVPIVGVCLGAQLIGAALGGQVAPAKEPEIGWHSVRLAFPGTIDPLYQGIAWDTVQFHMHGQEVTQLPPGATPLAGSKLCKNQAFKVGLTTYAFQYHFEWDQHDLTVAARDEFVTKSGKSPEPIIAEFERHYVSYRRLGDRLIDNIATLLVPVDKPMGLRRKDPEAASSAAADGAVRA